MFGFKLIIRTLSLFPHPALYGFKLTIRTLIPHPSSPIPIPDFPQKEIL
jgi:hypothetical protein